ncbi:MAG: tRNA (adenosine(37)-N6)-threonylcarbamoyltransferase complex dimerization subunit type 1 TsaB [Oscillospiraceae bacterium]|jgi:tRNA threonylcarbamoyladenosine biosynthesis protein TsaB|nr:tRNA (adenosine(37)-N6)-threonylcarbamoyltransferase complex dimerization subunit type 1 TsaB [Oscillospiraceae bacterium]
MLLAIDSSSLTASAALVRGGVLLAEGFINNGLTHSQTLAPLIDSVLKAAGAQPGDIREVAVTNGPGSFTGLRIGVATALGFAEARGIPCRGVSSLMAAAYGALDCEGTVCAVMDARRNQFYTALFHVKHLQLTRVSEDGALSKEELLSVPSPCVWAGDAAARCAREGDRVLSRPYVTGYGAALCYLNGHFTEADKINYLRKPQAERERELGRA